MRTTACTTFAKRRKLQKQGPKKERGCGSVYENRSGLPSATQPAVPRPAPRPAPMSLRPPRLQEAGRAREIQHSRPSSRSGLLLFQPPLLAPKPPPPHLRSQIRSPPSHRRGLPLNRRQLKRRPGTEKQKRQPVRPARHEGLPCARSSRVLVRRGSHRPVRPLWAHPSRTQCSGIQLLLFRMYVRKHRQGQATVTQRMLLQRQPS